MAELGSHAATERAAVVTLRLMVRRARILSRQPHTTFERRTVASTEATWCATSDPADPGSRNPGGARAGGGAGQRPPRAQRARTQDRRPGLPVAAGTA